MNILFMGAEMAATYAYPPLGAAIKGARYIKTAYDVTKAGICFFSGDYVGAALNANNALSCEMKRDLCVQGCSTFGYDPMGAGACLSGCWLGYKTCLAMRG